MRQHIKGLGDAGIAGRGRDAECFIDRVLDRRRPEFGTSRTQGCFIDVDKMLAHTTSIYHTHHVYLELQQGALPPNDGARAGLGDLLVNDPVVSMDDEDEFVAYVVSHLGEAPEIYATIREVNMGWHIPTHDEAMELEVGRNECALSE